MKIAIFANLAIETLRLNEWIEMDSNQYFVFTPEKYKKSMENLSLPLNIHIFFIENWNSGFELEDKLISLHNKECIERIISFRERDVMRAAHLRQFLDIPGQSVGSALLFRNKVEMKKYLHIHGIPTAKQSSISNYLDCLEFIIENNENFPFVLKPTDGAGSFNTFVVQNFEELKDLAKTLNFENFMIESFVKGDVYHVDVLIVNHSIRFMSASKYINDCLSYQHGISTASIFLPHNSSEVTRILEFAHNVISAMPLEESMILHIEIFDSPSGLILCEIACRAGGGQIVPIIERTLGINLYRELLYAQANTSDQSQLIPSEYHFITPKGWVLCTPLVGKLIDFPIEIHHDFVENYTIYTRKGMIYNQTTTSVLATASFEVGGNDFHDVKKNLIDIDKWFKDNTTYITPDNI